MPRLDNARHERFCQAIVDGNSQIDAYEHAGYARNSTSAWKLAQAAQIGTRIDQLMAQRQQEATVTRESHIADMQRLQRLAESKNDVKAAIQAAKNVGDVAGLYVTKTQDVTPDSPDEVARKLEALEAAAKARGLTH